ncbi:MAG: WecB/TagA/CpsF family glycosyltransferase [Acidocella sp.]|nr:WecB/TagA/CpsF family glycosyltransferase [Acidocella sp.]
MDSLIPAKVILLGTAFNDIDVGSAAARLLAWPDDARFGYVVTPNADHFDRLARIPALRMLYNTAALCVLDSKLISLLAGFGGLARPAVVTGTELCLALLPRLGGVRVAVIGMQGPAMAALRARYPSVDFTHHNPPMGLLHNDTAFFAARDFALASGARFTFIALGSPVQELLAYALSGDPRMRGVGLCIGAALDFCAGTMRRAPLWMRQNGLEWLHRLAQDPWRLGGRYLISDPRVIIRLGFTAFRQKAR